MLLQTYNDFIKGDNTSFVQIHLNHAQVIVNFDVRASIKTLSNKTIEADFEADAEAAATHNDQIFDRIVSNSKIFLRLRRAKGGAYGADPIKSGIS